MVLDMMGSASVLEGRRMIPGEEKEEEVVP
jgi:hypothetical protein